MLLTSFNALEFNQQ